MEATSGPQPTLKVSKKKATNIDEEYFIRNSYRHDLHLEIDNYQRRVYFSPTILDTNRLINSNISKGDKTSVKWHRNMKRNLKNNQKAQATNKENKEIAES